MLHLVATHYGYRIETGSGVNVGSMVEIFVGRYVVTLDRYRTSGIVLDVLIDFHMACEYLFVNAGYVLGGENVDEAWRESALAWAHDLPRGSAA